MTYRSDFEGMTDNIDLVIKLLWDIKDRISDREVIIQHNETNVISINDRIDCQLPPLNTFGV